MATVWEHDFILTSYGVISLLPNSIKLNLQLGSIRFDFVISFGWNFFRLYTSGVSTSFPLPPFHEEYTAKITARQLSFPVWFITAMSPSRTGAFLVHSCWKLPSAPFFRALAQGFWSKFRLGAAVPTNISAFRNRIKRKNLVGHLNNDSLYGILVCLAGKGLYVVVWNYRIIIKIFVIVSISNKASLARGTISFNKEYCLQQLPFSFFNYEYT